MNTKFSTQYIVLTVVSVFAMLAISVASALTLKQSLLEERKALLQSALKEMVWKKKLSKSWLLKKLQIFALEKMIKSISGSMTRSWIS